MAVLTSEHWPVWNILGTIAPFFGRDRAFFIANSRAAFSEGSPFYIEKKIHLELKGEKDGIR